MMRHDRPNAAYGNLVLELGRPPLLFAFGPIVEGFRESILEQVSSRFALRMWLLNILKFERVARGLQ